MEVERERENLSKEYILLGLELKQQTPKSQCLKHLKIVSLHPIYDCLPHTNIEMRCGRANATTTTTTITNKREEEKSLPNTHKAHEQATAIDQVEKFKFECDQHTTKCMKKIPLFDSKYHHGANCLLILLSDSMF